MNTFVLTDSTADLGETIAKEFNIGVIPLSVSIGDASYIDGVEIDQEKLFKLVVENNVLPKTAAPSVGEFKQFFQKDGSVIYVGISSKLSATIQNARLAADDLNKDDLHVIDSLNLSTGIGLLALRAAELRNEGVPASEIAAEITQLIPKVKTSFLIETMDYLYKGGRCSALQALAGSMLKIHPIIEVRSDGTLGAREKARGSRQRGLQLLLDDFTAHLDQLDRRRVFVTHTACQDDAEYLRDEIIRLASPADVRITLAGSVIASHCGPATIGILYCIK